MTPREKKIIILTAQGYTPKEIGDLLQISVYTIYWHYGRMGSRDRVYWTHRAIQKGWVKPGQYRDAVEGEPGGLVDPLT